MWAVEPGFFHSHLSFEVKLQRILRCTFRAASQRTESLTVSRQPRSESAISTLIHGPEHKKRRNAAERHERPRRLQALRVAHWPVLGSVRALLILTVAT